VNLWLEQENVCSLAVYHCPLELYVNINCHAIVYMCKLQGEQVPLQCPTAGEWWRQCVPTAVLRFTVSVSTQCSLTVMRVSDEQEGDVNRTASWSLWPAQLQKTIQRRRSLIFVIAFMVFVFPNLSVG